MSPAVKKLLLHLLSALVGALASYSATGCAGGPAIPAQVRSAADQALCAKSAAESFDAIQHPELLDATEAVALASALRECFAPPAPPSAADAGVK